MDLRLAEAKQPPPLSVFSSGKIKCVCASIAPEHLRMRQIALCNENMKLLPLHSTYAGRCNNKRSDKKVYTFWFISELKIKEPFLLFSNTQTQFYDNAKRDAKERHTTLNRRTLKPRKKNECFSAGANNNNNENVHTTLNRVSKSNKIKYGLIIFVVVVVVRFALFSICIWIELKENGFD